MLARMTDADLGTTLRAFVDRSARLQETSREVLHFVERGELAFAQLALQQLTVLLNELDQQHLVLMREIRGLRAAADQDRRA